MVELNINLGKRSYPIYIDSGFDQIGKTIRGAGINGRTVLITDENVDRYQSESCLNMLEAEGVDVFKYVIPAGEKSKNLETIKDIYSFLIDSKLDRNSALIALGGGVVGDITGFAAATFLRGIDFIQVPTTVLAQADSSVGGKVGVDFKGYKNMIGAFFQPKLVFINVDTIRSLPLRDIRSGLAEVIKHGVIADMDFFEYICCNIKKIFDFDSDVLKYLAKKNCMIKGRVVEEDEGEKGLRAVLNFGHTIGHAIESVMDFELFHGECVSIGMIGACKLAQYMNMMDGKEARKLAALLEKIGLPLTIKGIDVEKVYKHMYYDKKVKGGKLTFVLPNKIGEVEQCVVDDKKLIMKVLNELLEG